MAKKIEIVVGDEVTSVELTEDAIKGHDMMHAIVALLDMVSQTTTLPLEKVLEDLEELVMDEDYEPGTIN